MNDMRLPAADTDLSSESALALHEVIIRPLKSVDLPALEWDGEYTHFRTVYQKVYDRMLSGKALMWAMELPGREIIGQAFVQLKEPDKKILQIQGRQGYIHSFRVRPAYRSMGFGRKLLAFIEDDLIHRGYNYATLNVGLTNHSAKRLYTRMGYRVVGRDPGAWSYYDHLGVLRRVSEPGWYMRKKLQG